MLRAGKATNLERLSFIEADLINDDGWTDAVKDCTYVLPVASPLPASAPKNENELIKPAREGTLRVLRAARDAKVKRVVVTSSSAAIEGHGRQDRNKVLTEEDWSDVNAPGLGAYAKSKTLAERAAWDFIKNEDGGLELSVINPGMIAGPVLALDTSSSIEANGERFLCLSQPQMSMKDISLALRERLGDKAKRCPTRSIPDFVVRIMGIFDSGIVLVVPMLGQTFVVSVDNVLGWTPRSSVDAVVAAGESLYKLGLVKK
ncbi:uncharacterized protein N7483_007217 [Penicillium malachiteum]|uniref:uncharacterized protein n=1 Tax=Penicillium malachiteum TaxID=1324776 RepID=UPI00254743A1|nr:uncharacterized protein N7483_007217 [Penicillium malachiteum]KAJ5725860.1 hypothetical protein N7483_007217 [Penicillium malachiteum]